MGIFWNDPEKNKKLDIKKEKKVVQSVQPTQTTEQKHYVAGSLLSTTPHISTTNTVTSTSTTASVDSGKKEQYIEHLKKVMKDANIPGPDYYEFELALESMKSLPIDEKTKFITIFAGFQVQGVTKDKLVETANHYIDIISGVKEGFEKDVENAFNTDVKAEEDQITQIESQNQEIDKQMIELTNKKLANQESIKTLKESITHHTNQINGQKSDFDIAYNEQVSDINKNIELINTHLS